MSWCWYAIYTKHQHEKSVSELLSRKKFEVLLPLYTTVHRWRDRNKKLQLPLFPCYLFVRTDLSRKLDILQTPGVFFMVDSGGRAFPVPDKEIDAIKKIAQHPSKAGPHPYWKTGDRVRICSGPLAGVEGILIRSKGQFRVILTVELLRQSVAIEVDLSDVERLPWSGPRAALSCASEMWPEARS